MLLKRLLPYIFHILLACGTVLSAYFFLKPHYKTTGLTIGLVNLQRIRSQAEPFQLLAKQVTEAHTKLQEEFQNLEKNLHKEYEELQALQQKKHAKTKDLSERKAALDKKVAEVEQQVQQERDEMRQKIERIHKAIEDELERIIQAYRVEHQIDLFLNTTTNDQQIALVADDCLNHTDDIIEILNKITPKIEELKS